MVLPLVPLLLEETGGENKDMTLPALNHIIVVGYRGGA